LLGLLVASAAFAIAAADENMTRCLLDYKTIVSNFIEEYGESKIKLIDLINLEKIVIMELKAYINPRARNIIQQPRMLIVVYIKCPDDTKELLKELVKYLIEYPSEYYFKIVFDGQNATQLGSIPEYTNEASHKVISRMNIQLKEVKSRSQTTIFYTENATIITKKDYDVFTKNSRNVYTTKNGIEQVIRLKSGNTIYFIKFIEISRDHKKYIRENGACIIGSTNIQCKDKEGTSNNKTTATGIMYVDNGTICENISCPADYKMYERNCIDGALTGPGYWCRGKQTCDEGSQEIGDYCYRKTTARVLHNNLENLCGQQYPGYSNAKAEILSNRERVNKACETESGVVSSTSELHTTMKCQSVDNGVLTLEDGTKYDKFFVFGNAGHALVFCYEGELEIHCGATDQQSRLCVKSRIILW